VRAGDGRRSVGITPRAVRGESHFARPSTLERCNKGDGKTAEVASTATEHDFPSLTPQRSRVLGPSGDFHHGLLDLQEQAAGFLKGSGARLRMRSEPRMHPSGDRSRLMLNPIARNLPSDARASTPAPRAPALHPVPRPVVGRPANRAVELPTADPAMKRLLSEAQRLARTDLNLVVRGETGAGKEVLVRYLHAASGRAGGPWIAENCSAISESLAESILFGHVRGAFTGADRDRPGLFVLADGGTLFLDEIGDMPSAMQARLLRVLEERRVRPVGGERSIPFDVRVVCATNHDLAELVRAGRFRADLLFRLTGASFCVPALRDRPADVPFLAARFLDELNAQYGTTRRYSRDLLDRLQRHDWPGNVRELKNCVTALYSLSEQDEIDGPLLRVSEPRPFGAEVPLLTRVAPLAEIERAAIRLALEETGGDRREAARRLGISRSTLYARLGATASPNT